MIGGNQLPSILGNDMCCFVPLQLKHFQKYTGMPSSWNVNGLYDYMDYIATYYYIFLFIFVYLIHVGWLIATCGTI